MGFILMAIALARMDIRFYTVTGSPGAMCIQRQQAIQQVKSKNMKLISNKQLS
jgi:hypothetical protein